MVLAVNEDCLAEATATHPDTITVFRDLTCYLDAPPNIDETDTYGATLMAEHWYPQLKAVWDQNHPADYYTVLNEPGGNDPTVIPNYIAYENKMIRLAEQDGLKICMCNLAGGTPGSFQLWMQTWLPHIAQHAHNGHIYGRHAYGGLLASITDDGDIMPYDSNTGRPLLEADYMDLRHPQVKMLITELGFYGGWELPDETTFVENAALYDLMLDEFPNILGTALYTLGNWGPANFQAYTATLAQWLFNRNSTNPPPEPEQYRKTLHLLPQRITEDEFLTVLTESNLLHNRNTLTFSLDDATELSLLPSTRPDSTIHTWYQHRWSQEEQDQLDDLPIQIIKHHNQTVNDPLEGLILDVLFYEPHVITSHFNEPRDYGNGLHEGIDIDVISSEPDSDALVRAPYPGIVNQTTTGVGNYYNYVKVRHEYNDYIFYTWYCHLDHINVTAGQSVFVGTPIGEIGATGNTTGEHLHFNLQVPGYGLEGYVVPHVVDPEPYITINNPPPPHQPYDLLPYMRGDGRAYRIRANIQGNVTEEILHTITEGNTFYQVKNNHWEQLFADNDFIYRGIDTSPDQNRYYLLTDHDLDDRSRWIPRHMIIGQSYLRHPHVQFFHKHNCEPDPNNSGHHSSNITLTAHYNQWTSNYGHTLQDVISLTWADGLETYYYAKHHGLVGWQSHTGDYSSFLNYTDNGLPREHIGCL